MTNPIRPFKVWNGNRSIKKSVTVSSLEDLIQKGKSKLNFLPTDRVCVVFEEDGTEIDDEDYFAFVPSNSTLLFLKSSEKWCPSTDTGQKGIDETDFGVGITDRTKHLIMELKKDLTRIIAFSNDDLQQIVSTPINDLCHLLNETESYARALQEACQRHLDERQQTTEAMDLLRLYHQSHKNSPYVEDDNRKKRKPDVP